MRVRVPVRRWLSRHRRVLFRTGGVVAGLTAIGGFLWLLLGPVSWLLGGEMVRSLDGRAQVETLNSIRRILLYAIGGVAVLGSLVFTARNHLLAKEGQITERFTSAVEQLGSESRAVRTGAVYSLERTMRDSSADHASIVEVLAAFVREKARLGIEADSADTTPFAGGTGPPTDVRAAVTVLVRRPVRSERAIVDLRHTDLRLLELLPGASMDRFDLSGACLQEALLEGINLQDAIIVGADLREAYLTEVRLEGAILSESLLYNAKLLSAQAEGAHFEETDLRDATLGGAELKGASFIGAQLQGVDLSMAWLEGVLFGEAQLQGANLFGAKLEGASFRGANLQMTRGLTIDRLLTAHVFDSTKLDGSLAEDPRVVQNRLSDDQHWTM